MAISKAMASTLKPPISPIPVASTVLFSLCFAFVWLIATGSWVVKNGLRHLVDRSRRDKSYFRIGWDWIERLLRLDKEIRITLRPYP